MANTFPIITKITDVLAAIEGRSEFGVGKASQHFDLVAYYLLDSDSFKSDDPNISALRRECRGLLFHKDGTIARRAFHKFFNVGETEETFREALDMSMPYTLLEKLDGSMVGPFISKVDGEVYWASMRGSWDYNQILSGLYKGTSYETFVRELDAENITAIFEYCAPDNRIVVEYPKAEMTLLALRHRETGQYLPWQDVQNRAQLANIPLVKPFETTAKNITELLQQVETVQGIEGAVICFDDGRRAKLKGAWYQQLHKLLSYFEFEKDIARLILSNNQDDLMGILTPDKKLALINYQDSLLSEVKNIAQLCCDVRKKILANNIDRKSFAQSNLAPSSIIKSIIFRHFDKVGDIDFIEDVIASALKQTGSHGKWSTFKKNVNITVEWAEVTY